MPAMLEFRPASPPPEAPLHGWQGERGPTVPAGFQPAALCIAISRETGARGITIAKGVSKKLRWQYFDQEMLEYIAQEERHRRELFDSLEPDALQWVQAEQQRLVAESLISRDESILELARVVLALGTKGETVILGRGAGCILPRDTVLRVRLIAPLAERIASMAQFQRLTPEQAADVVCANDRQRAEFMQAHFFRRPDDIYQYDMVLNPSFLGIEAATQAIAAAAQAKNARWQELRDQQGMTDTLATAG